VPRAGALGSWAQPSRHGVLWSLGPGITHGLISPVSSCLTWGAGGVVGQDPGCSSHISLVSPWSFRDVDSLPQGHIQTCKLHDQRVCAGHLLGPGDLGQPHHTLSLDWPPLGGTQQVVSSHQSPGSDRLFPRHLGPCRVRVSLCLFLAVGVGSSPSSPPPTTPCLWDRHFPLPSTFLCSILSPPGRPPDCLQLSSPTPTASQSLADPPRTFTRVLPPRSHFFSVNQCWWQACPSWHLVPFKA
jgi:hypothetical protein